MRTKNVLLVALAVLCLNAAISFLIARHVAESTTPQRDWNAVYKDPFSTENQVVNVRNSLRLLYTELFVKGIIDSDQHAPR